MSSTLVTLFMVLAAAAAALMAALSVAGAMHLTARREHGYMHLAIPIMLVVLAVGAAVSGRDMTTNHLLPETASMPTVRGPLLSVLQPLASLLLLAISAERVLTHMLVRRTPTAPPVMLVGFTVFWLGTVASPALLGAHPKVTHDYLYPLMIGLGAALSNRTEQLLALRSARNALLLFMALGLVLMPFQPRLVMDSAYTQGLLPGLPRFAGMAAHPVSMGLLAQLGLLCLLALPYSRPGLNRAAWVLGLLALVLAQSKTAWVAFLLCSACLVLMRWGPALQRRLGDAQRPEVGMLLVLSVMGAVVGLALVLMLGDLGTRLDRFLNSSEGAQLASLTGRDQIWAIAWDEWARHPLFGYGPELWGADFRRAIGMSNATHAHNQFMDTLSRSGLVGATALVLYALLLLGLSLRYACATGGLSLALLVALVLRSASEVPLLLFGYGSELIIHLLLLITLAAAARQAQPAALSTEGGAHPPRHGAPPPLRSHHRSNAAPHIPSQFTPA